MIIEIQTTKAVEIKTVRFHAKIREIGTYELLDGKNNLVSEHEGYVPEFFPYGERGNGNHYGDYIDLWIDIETGVITNWKKPIESELQSFVEKKGVYETT